MQKLFLPLALAAFVVNPAWAQLPVPSDSSPSTLAYVPERPFEAAGLLTLAMALEWAMRASADIAIAAREVEALEGSVRQAGIIPNPSLGALVEDTRQATRTTTVQINVSIELGGKRAARKNAAERARDAAATELVGKRAEVRAVNAGMNVYQMAR